MRGLLSIGQFSRVARLSARTLRRYDEQGLLVPAVVDSVNRRRWYSPAQAGDAQLITRLRTLDVPLDMIADILAEPDPTATRARLARHRAVLQAELARRQAALRTLDDLLDDLQTVVVRPVALEHRPSQRVLSLRVRTSLNGIAEAAASSFARLNATIGGQPAGLEAGAVTGAPMAIYHGDEFDPDDVDVEFAQPVGPQIRPSAPCTTRAIPAGLVAVTIHVGAYDRIDAAYEAIGTWAVEQDVALSPQPREVYLVGPDRASPTGLRTAVEWPVDTNQASSQA